MTSNLKDVALFHDIREEDLPSLLQCLNAHVKTFDKGEIIFMEGDRATAVGLVKSGNVQLVKEDIWGNRTIVAYVADGELFAEAYSCMPDGILQVGAVAMAKSKIMLIDYQRVVTTCPSSCSFHTQLIRNMMGILAENNIRLNRKIEHTSKRTTREKLMSYLMERARSTNSNRFEIPFNRQELADYLNVERSAMSAELGRMRDDGLLQFHKNRFEILKTLR